MTLNYISSHLNTHNKCVKYLEEKRWNGEPTCPYCKSKKCSPKKLRYTCLNCSNSFSVTVGTFMENSNLPLQKWLMAICLMLSAKKGLSAMQLSRDISVNKNTSWLLQMKIRTAMKDGQLELFKPKKQLSNGSPNGTDTISQDRVRKGYGVKFLKNQAFGHWSLFKRAIIGQYHKIEPYYIDRYIDEINFKRRRRRTKDNGYQEILDRLLFVTLAK
jgi:transposase-like protein